MQVCFFFQNFAAADDCLDTVDNSAEPRPCSPEEVCNKLYPIETVFGRNNLLKSICIYDQEIKGVSF